MQKGWLNIVWMGSLLLVLLVGLVGCLGDEMSTTPVDGDDPDESDGDDPDGDSPDGDNPDGDSPDGDNPDGDTQACDHLCDCPQGWFCNDAGQCEDGTGMLGTPFCCVNPECPYDAPCVYPDDSPSRCAPIDSCPFSDTVVGRYCPDSENVCEAVAEVVVGQDDYCLFMLTFTLDDGSTLRVYIDGYDYDTIFNLEEAGCSVSFDADAPSFEIACNWCGTTTFSKDNCQADQCTSDSDCPDCELCETLNGVKQCLATPGALGCVSDDDCETGFICAPFSSDKPQCGGQCVLDDDGKYILHEWGVNRPMSDGSSLISSGPPRFWGAVPAKPVLYVYADNPLLLDVGVTFASGHTTDTWPPLPNGASIEWQDVLVTQPATCNLSPTPIPPYDQMEPEDREIYQLPEWIVPDADCLKTDGVTSKLLFYTGELSDYEPPVSGSVDVDASAAEVTFNLTNSGDVDVESVLLLYRTATGECIDPSGCSVNAASLAWGKLRGLAAGASSSTTLELHTLATDGSEPYQNVTIPEGWKAMADDMESMLSSKGLYADEIDVFMDAWETMFFGVHSGGMEWYLPGYQNGAFVLYLWPDSLTEEQLALSLDPQPRELKRAMVEFNRLAPPDTEGALAGEVTLVEYDIDPDSPTWTGPAVGATVTATESTYRNTYSATTGDDGTYRMSLPTGVYTVTVTRNDWEHGDRIDRVAVLSGQTTTVNLNLFSEAMVDKPNLYLYPTQTTQVGVTLALCGDCVVTESIPEYGSGWDVTVEPSGLIDDTYTYLYYEAEIARNFPMHEGWSIPAADVPRFFNETLAAYGLTAAETADFVDYWSTHLPDAPFYGIYPLTEASVIEPLVGLRIDPQPDSLFRLWFVVSPEVTPPALSPPVIDSPPRIGFTAVEWGVILD